MHLHPWEASPCRESRAFPPTVGTSPTGQARVRIDGRDHYLGPHGSEESKQKYEQIVRKLITARTRTSRARVEIATDLTINELVLRYLRFVDGYYPSTSRPTSGTR